jgi:hypothetical protein
MSNRSGFNYSENRVYFFSSEENYWTFLWIFREFECALIIELKAFTCLDNDLAMLARTIIVCYSFASVFWKVRVDRQKNSDQFMPLMVVWNIDARRRLIAMFF